MEKSYVTAKNLCKFLFGSAFGVLMFLVPIPQGEGREVICIKTPASRAKRIHSFTFVLSGP